MEKDKLTKIDIKSHNRVPPKLSFSLFASRPAAGFPAPGDDELETALNLNDLLIENPDSSFFVRVEGDSMEGARIFAGDILVVDRVEPAVDGSIVVAAVYGEMVVKRLVKKSDGTWLKSENDNYAPIRIDSNDDCYIWGVVTGSARVF